MRGCCYQHKKGLVPCNKKKGDCDFEAEAVRCTHTIEMVQKMLHKILHWRHEIWTGIFFQIESWGLYICNNKARRAEGKTTRKGNQNWGYYGWGHSFGNGGAPRQKFEAGSFGKSRTTLNKLEGWRPTKGWIAASPFFAHTMHTGSRLSFGAKISKIDVTIYINLF